MAEVIRLKRDQLERFIPDYETLQQFELLFETLDTINATTLVGLRTDVDANTVRSTTNETSFDNLESDKADILDPTFTNDITVNNNIIVVGLVDGRDIAADGSKLDTIASGAQVNTVLSVNGYVGAVALVASDVGLGNVDNTSDADKPVSTSQQTALDLKQDILTEGPFVDGDKDKLDGIESDADVNPTPAEIVADIDAELGQTQWKNDAANGYTVFSVWAEEGAGLGDNSFEWAFGNGQNTPLGRGIAIPTDCELFALGCTSGGTPVGTVIRAVINSDDTQSAYDLTFTGGSGIVTFPTPLSFSAGDIFNFKTITAGGASGAIASAFFRIVSTPQTGGLIGDLTDVDTTGLTTDDILRWDGVQFSRYALSGKEDSFSKNTAFNKNYGTGSDEVCVGDDSRLSDSRTCNNTFDNAATSRTALDVYSTSEVDTELAGKFDTFTRSTQVPTTGFSITLTQDSTNQWLVLNPAGSLASGIITLVAPGSAADLQELMISSVTQVTALTVAGNGGTVYGAPTALAAGKTYRAKYDSSLTAWFFYG